MAGQRREASAAELFRELADIADGLETPIDVNRLVEISAQSYLRLAGTSGSFESAIGVESMTLETVVERPEGCSWVVRRTGNDFRVHCGASMALPLKLTPAMEFFEKNAIFRVADMPSLMADSAKLTLSRNLVRKGLLRISQKPAPVLEESVPVPAASGDLSWLAPNAGV